MIAGQLDQQMLVDHEPDKLLALLAPTSSHQIRAVVHDHDFANAGDRIDPTVRLDPAQQPRVSGRVTYRSLIVHGLRDPAGDDQLRLGLRVRPARPTRSRCEHDEITGSSRAPTTCAPATRACGSWHDQSYGALVDCAAGGKGLLAPTPVDGGGPGPSQQRGPEQLPAGRPFARHRRRLRSEVEVPVARGLAQLVRTSSGRSGVGWRHGRARVPQLLPGRPGLCGQIGRVPGGVRGAGWSSTITGRRATGG